ncbi:glycosyl transferase family 25 [Catenulispora sp. GP43]|uniref:glycosyltransferase family 25 protein n=1 Tax=Catenulispora sp. GP43 TaxID=3156263 RepID=UPI003512A032
MDLFLEDLQVYVVNLRRRSDRRKHMKEILPMSLAVEFTSEWEREFDGAQMEAKDLRALGIGLFPWRIDSENFWWARDLKFGEIGCTLSHLACWRRALESGRQLFLVLEDDVSLSPDFCNRVLAGINRARRRRVEIGLVYLGRVPLEPDLGPAPDVPELVIPGYSHCTYGYVMSRDAAAKLLAVGLERDVIPIDEFLPAMYLDHPRADVRARYQKCINALAFSPDLVIQLPKEEAGSDTEESSFAKLD